MISILIDDGLVLRTLQPEDAEELFKTVDASREHLRGWLPWVDSTQKPEHSLQFIQHSRASVQNQQGIALGIIYEGKIAGSMGMHSWDHHLKKAQLGYWVAKEHEGKGIVRRCMEGFISFLFDKVGLNKVEVQFMVSNKRSAAVAERVGFKVEGIIRHSYILNGKYHDLVLAGLLKEEWPGMPDKSKVFRPV